MEKVLDCLGPAKNRVGSGPELKNESSVALAAELNYGTIFQRQLSVRRHRTVNKHERQFTSLKHSIDDARETSMK
jgi:hypothetical protein